MEEKISIAEIQQLLQEAESERQTHRRIMRLIYENRHSVQCLARTLVPISYQQQIIKRRRPDEIEAMLEAYANLGLHSLPNTQNLNLSEDAQAEIWSWLDYENAQANSLEYQLYRLCWYMLENNLLSPETEQKLVQRYAFMPRRYDKIQYLEQTEVFMLQELERNMDFFTFQDLVGYLSRHRLHRDAETGLMGLKQIKKDGQAVSGSEVIECYLKRYKNLRMDAQRELINRGDHNLIMLYIKESEYGLDASNELFERGNRAEVEAFIARYRLG